MVQFAKSVALHTEDQAAVAGWRRNNQAVSQGENKQTNRAVSQGNNKQTNQAVSPGNNKQTNQAVSQGNNKQTNRAVSPIVQQTNKPERA